MSTRNEGAAQGRFGLPHEFAESSIAGLFVDALGWDKRLGFLVFASIRASDRIIGYSGEGERLFRREAERRSGRKLNSSRSEATLAW
jgi:hypothetical protein